MKRTAIYIRVSSDKQVQEGDSIAAQIELLQTEVAEGPAVNTEALKQLQGMNFRGIYEGMELDEKRRFWRAIIKVIWFDEERNINVEFL